MYLHVWCLDKIKKNENLFIHIKFKVYFPHTYIFCMLQKNTPLLTDHKNAIMLKQL